MTIARFRVLRSDAVVEVSDDLTCTCDPFRAVGDCEHAAMVRRYRRWRIVIDPDTPQPPPRK